MGNCHSRASNRGSSRDKVSTTNLLLLGSESANTLRILRQIEYQHILSTTRDLTHYIIAIRKYTVSMIVKLYNKCKALFKHNPTEYKRFGVDGIDLDRIQFLQSTLDKLNDLAWLTNKAYLLKIKDIIQYLWKLDAIQCCWQLVYSSNMNIKHFMDKIDSIMTAGGYQPSFDDVMSMPYSSASEVSLSFYETQMNIVTVNASKYSKKWLHSFDHAAGIIFVVTLSDFDRNHSRIQQENALIHSMNKFDKIVNDPAFNKTPIMLIFDDFDTFRTKINNGSSISNIFTTYNDHNDTEQNIYHSLQFIREQFMDKIQNKAPQRTIYQHVSSVYGGDIEQMHELFMDVQHVKVSKNLDFGGML